MIATLAQLPPPPPGKIGWPWTQASPPLAAKMPDGSDWPRITIVTPSYNQAEFLEATLRSVLAQGYPDLEYIVIDGGSTDGSVEIIRRYEPWLSAWVSQPDQGQSDAINKGFERASGQILGWINSDDLLAPGGLGQLAIALGNHDQPAWVIGSCHIINAQGELMATRTYQNITRESTADWANHYFMQPAVFFTRRLWHLAGPLDQSLHYTMDFDLWLAFFEHCHPTLVAAPLAIHRVQGSSKTSNANLAIYQDFLTVIERRFPPSQNQLRQLALASLAKRAVNRANALCFQHQNALAFEHLKFAYQIYPAIIFVSKLYVVLAKLIVGRERVDRFKKIFPSLRS